MFDFVYNKFGQNIQILLQKNLGQMYVYLPQKLQN